MSSFTNWSKRNFIVAAVALSSVGAAAVAADPSFTEGVQQYNSRQYLQAIDSFTRALKAQPGNGLAAYYRGLSYQGLRQMSLAKADYLFAASSRDVALRTQATKALESLERYGSSHGSLTSVASASSSTASNAGSKSEGAKQSSGKFRGVLKVIDVSATWCGPCKRFAPIFESVSSQFARKGTKFSSLDLDDPSNADFIAKYGVTAVPTIIFTDDTGKLLRKHVGAYDSESEFSSEVNSFYE